MILGARAFAIVLLILGGAGVVKTAPISLKISAPAAVPPALLSRPLSEGDSLEWRSLPVGKYRVLVKGSATGAHEQIPVILDTIEIVSGETLIRTVPAPRMARNPDARNREPNPDLLLTLQNWNPQDRTEDPFLVYRLTANSVERLAEVRTFQEGSHLLLPLPDGCVEDSSYIVQVSDLVSPPILLEAGSCTGPTSRMVTLEPAIRLMGQAIFPARSKAPESGQFWTESCRNDETAERFSGGMYPAFISDGRLTATLMEGCFRLALQLPGFAPVTFPNTHLWGDEPYDLGRFLVFPGAAVLARVVVEETLTAASGVTVAAVAEVDQYEVAAAVYGESSFRPRSKSAVTDAQGWMRLAGLAEGRYYLLLQPPEESGGVPIFHGPVRLEAGKELVLEDVRLPAPALVSVVLDPGTVPRADSFEARLRGFLDPGCGRLHSASLDRPIPWSEPLELTGLVPGRWEFSASIRGPDEQPLEIALDSVELEAGDNGVVALAAQGDFYIGQVLLEDEPVSTSLDFLPRFPFQGSLPRARSNAEGLFLVGLAEPGIYSPRYSLGSMELALLADDVEFRGPEELVVVHLPPYSLRGQVVDEQGSPLPGAAVLVRQDDSSKGAPRAFVETAANTDSEGTFHFPSLPKGRWTIMAALPPKGEPRSDDQQVLLSAQNSSQEITLTVEEGVTIEGTLSAGGRPVAGATLRGWFARMDTPQKRSFYQVETDAAGRFQLQVRRSERGSMNVQFFVPGLPVSVRRLPLEGSLAIDLSPAGGRLSVAPGDGGWGPADGGDLYLVFEDGGLIQLRAATGSLAETTGPEIVVPDLAPGRWSLVRLPPLASPEFALLMEGRGTQLDPAATFEVLPGRETHLVIEGG